MTNEEFYQECAELLNTTYDCQPFPWTSSGVTRWNNRAPGSGRYPGHGLIRCYGSVIHVNLHTPVTFNKVFSSKEEALLNIRRILKNEG